jgi:hypothetical protein
MRDFFQIVPDPMSDEVRGAGGIFGAINNARESSSSGPIATGLNEAAIPAWTRGKYFMFACRCYSYTASPR